MYCTSSVMIVIALATESVIGAPRCDNISLEINCLGSISKPH
jgi:hypothetical protein